MPSAAPPPAPEPDRTTEPSGRNRSTSSSDRGPASRGSKGILAGLRNRWRHHVGDRPLAAAIHREIVALGYARSTARIRDLRLAAVERPGYRQVYRFEASARDRDDESVADLYGVSREDPRSTRIDVKVTASEVDRDRVFAAWSDGMITLETMRERRRSRLEIALLAAFGIAIALAIVSAITGS